MYSFVFKPFENWEFVVSLVTVTLDTDFSTSFSSHLKAVPRRLFDRPFCV